MFGGIPMVDNPDPVLRYMANRDEEFYRTMERSELAIYSAKQHRTSALLSAGSEVVEGSSGSEKSIMLKNWTIQFLKGIKQWTTVQEKMLDAIYWGWRPMEVFWNFDMKFDGKTYWGVNRVSEKMPEDFRFTPERQLVYVGNGIKQGEYIVFNRKEDAYHWLICTAGSTNNPYGDALYKNIWLIWYIKNRFMQMWSQGMERSLGVLKAKEEFSFNSPDRSKSVSELATELQEITQKLSQNNILIERAGWTLDFLTDIDFSEGWQHPLAYCDEQITLAITGQTMTMRIGSSGSRSAAQVHRQALMDFAKRDAKQLESWVNDGLVLKAIELNFGVVSDEDMPRWRTNISNPIDIENSERLYQMGAPIDGRRLAHAVGVPIVTDPGPDDLVLQQPSPLEIAAMRGPTSPNENKIRDPDSEDSDREDQDGVIDDRPNRTLNLVRGANV